MLTLYREAQRRDKGDFSRRLSGNVANNTCYLAAIAGASVIHKLAFDRSSARERNLVVIQHGKFVFP